jgi:sulfur relay (sulfurtransferase) DsrC/TusE family protein
MFRSSVTEKIAAYDKVGTVRAEVNKALMSLKELRRKYPFTENFAEIEWLDPDRLFKVNPDETGEFFRLMEGYLKPLGYSTMTSSNVYRNTRLQIKEFKNLLRIVVDDRKSLAEKIDAPWERIGGLGQDKHLAKQIIFCYNYDRGTVLPIFSNQHLRHFTSRISDSLGQTKYLSAGQEYEHYIKELIAAKNSLSTTKAWDVTYFARFLYQTYPPPDSERVGVNSSSDRKVGVAVSNEQLELQGFMRLLGELQKQNKINGEQFRDYRSLWNSQPSDREGLVGRLKKLLNAEA